MTDKKKNNMKDMVVGILIAVIVAVGISYGIVEAKKPAPIKIAYVDITKIITASKEVAVLKEEQKLKMAELQDFVAKALEDLNAQKDKKKKAELEKKYNAELNNLKAVMEASYAEKLREMDENILQQIKKVAKANGYAYVFSTVSLLAGGYDLTDKVVEAVK